MLKNKKGFSLIELIVVIAILAVFAAILVPSLLQYTENSRAQKDESAMDEVVNAVQLALADQDCFDEMLQYSCTNNFVTYSDSTGDYASQVVDGEFWAPDGAGRATTITFNPETGYNNSTVYKMDTAIINDMTYGNGSVAHDRVMEGALIDNNQCYLKNASLNGNATGYMYNRVRQTVGDSVVSTSQTYRNSSFTVFIRFTQKDGITVAEVHGQFNGTNLYEGAPSSVGTGTTEYEPETGAPIVTVTNPGTQKSEYTSSDIGGTGSFGGASNINNQIDDYKQPTYIENLQKENKCEYYSTLALAAQDINNGTPGINGDSTKEGAAACVYVDEQGISSVIILQSRTETQSTIFEKKVNVIIGGKQITYSDAPEGMWLKEGGNVDGRIHGSKLINISQYPFAGDNTIQTTVVRAEKDCVISGGEYEIPNAIYGYTIFMKSKYNLTVKDAKVTAKGVVDTTHDWNGAYAIFYNGSSTDGDWLLTVDNCDLYAGCPGKLDAARCINALGRAKIINTRAQAYADTWSDGSAAHSATSVYCAWQSSIIENCELHSTGNGVYASTNASVTIKNSAIDACDYVVRATSEAKTLRILDSKLILAQRPSGYKDHSGYANMSLYVQNQCAIAHNCLLIGNVNITENAKLFISMSQLDSASQITIKYASSKLYLGARNGFNKSQCSNQSRVEETGLIYKDYNP